MKSLLIDTSRNFNTVIDRNKTFFDNSQDVASCTAFENDIKNIKDNLYLIRSNKKNISVNVVALFHGNWVRTNLHRALIKLSKIQRLIYKMKLTEDVVSREKILQSIKKELSFAILNVQHGAGIMDKQYIFKDIKSGEGLKYIVDTNEIEIGDVVLSYKTSEYLKNDILANLIAYTTRSHITHVSVVCGIDDEGISIITAKPEQNGLAIVKLGVVDGEVLVILKSTQNKIDVDRVIKSLDLWKVKALQNESKKGDKQYMFSEIKSWTACLVGMMYSRSVHILRKGIVVPNPFSKSPGLFCSELVDNIFKDAGVFLVPRSEYNSIVGPVEILYSPLLTFRGLIGSKKDINLLEKEISYI